MIAIYCRQSVEKRDSISIEQQEAACRRLTGNALCTVFCDRGFTGANTRRPGFEAMMQAVCDGRVTRVVVYKVDRISRSLLDFVGIYHRFEQHHVEFLSCSEQFDTSTAMGKATLQIIMVFAELERNMIVKRVRDNFYERGRKGLYLAGSPPFGFCKTETVVDGIHTCCLSPDTAHPERLQAVIRMFEDCRQHCSLGSIARRLNEQGLCTSRGKAFTAASVGRILRNTVYVRADAAVYRYLKAKGASINQPIEDFRGCCGCTVYGPRGDKTTRKFTDLHGDYVQLNRHEGIISSSDWLAVQELLDTHRPVGSSGGGHRTWLTGLTVCRFCGKAVSAVGSRRYLLCGGRKTHTCSGRPDGITFDMLEQAVLSCLTEYIRTLNLPMTDKRNNAEENNIHISLSRNREALERLAERAVLSDIALMPYLNERARELEAENERLRQKLTLLHQTAAVQEDVSLREYLSELNALSFDEKNLIARTLIEKVEVGEGRLDIIYR